MKIAARRRKPFPPGHSKNTEIRSARCIQTFHEKNEFSRGQQRNRKKGSGLRGRPRGTADLRDRLPCTKLNREILRRRVGPSYWGVFFFFFVWLLSLHTHAKKETGNLRSGQKRRALSIFLWTCAVLMQSLRIRCDL